MKILFMGTPLIAMEVIKKIHSFYNIVGVFTKIDKIKNRGHNLEFSDVKTFALENNLKLFQPDKLKDYIDIISELNPDVIVVAAYGKILPKEILSIPKFGCINIHTSLLPEYRGAAPIHSVLLNGEEKTGITFIKMNEKMDEGNILYKYELKISEDDNYGTLYKKLTDLACNKINLVLNDVKNWKEVEQDHSKSTYTKMIKKEDSYIDWNRSSKEIYNMIRAYNPVMPARFNLAGNVFQVYTSQIYNSDVEGSPGEIISINKLGPVVKTKDSSLILTNVKPSNKKLLSGREIINGKYMKLGDILKND